MARAALILVAAKVKAGSACRRDRPAGGHFRGGNFSWLSSSPIRPSTPRNYSTPQFFTYSVQDIGTLFEFRSHENNPLHSLHEALDVWGLTMNDANFAIVQSIGHYTSASAIPDPTDDQSLDWQVIGLSVAYNEPVRGVEFRGGTVCRQ